jgi:hypothetical protein
MSLCSCSWRDPKLLKKYSCPLNLITLGLFSGVRAVAQEEVFAVVETHARACAFGERAAHGQQQRLHVSEYHGTKGGPGEDGSKGLAVLAVHACIVALLAIFASCFRQLSPCCRSSFGSFEARFCLAPGRASYFLGKVENTSAIYILMYDMMPEWMQQD